MKRLLKWILILLLILLLLLMVTLSAAYWVAGTDKGLAFAANEASNRVEGLELTEPSGNMLHGITAQKINYKDAAINVSATGLDSSWQLSCLTQKTFCLENVVIDTLDIETFATNKKDDVQTGPIELPEIKLPLGVNVNDVLIRQLNLKLPGESAPYELNNVRVSLIAEGNDIEINNLSAEYDAYSASVNGSLSLSEDYPLNLQIQLLADDALPDSIPEGEGAQPATLNIKLSNSLRQLELKTEVSGFVDATIEGAVSPLDATLPVDLIINSESLGWPLVSQSQIWANNNNISINGSLEDYTVSVFTRIQGVEVPATTLQLSGDVNQERASLPAISIDTLGGNAFGQADVSWKDKIQWSTEWNFNDIDPGVYRGDLNGKLGGQINASGTVENENWSLVLPKARIEGEFQGYPFDLNVNASKGLDNIWAIETARLNNGKNRIDASGSVGERWNIKALANVPELQKLLPDLSGALNANLTLEGDLESPDIEVVASSAAFAFNDINISGFSLKADINSLLDQDSDIGLAVGKVVSGETTIQNGRFTLNGNRKKHNLTLFADGPQATAIDLAATGALSDALNWDGRFDDVTIEVPAHIIKLAKPTKLSWNNRIKKLAIDAHCWITEGSNLCLQNEVFAEAKGTAKVSLDQYSLSRLNPFLPAKTSMTGQLSFDTDIRWGPDQIGGFGAVLQAQVKDGGAQVVDANDDIVRFTYNTLELDTKVNPEDVDANIRLASQTLGKANVQFNLDPSKADKPINGSISLDGFDLGIALAFLPDFDEVNGTLNIDGGISGSLTDPRFDGKLVIDDPILRAEVLPLPITGGQLVTSVKGRRAVIDGNLASDQGSIAIEGSANWRKLDAWVGQLKLVGKSLNIQSDPIQESSVFHTITIDASPRNISIRGDVAIPSAVIDVEELPQGAARVSGDVVIIEDIEEEAETKPQAQSPSPDGPQLLVDIDISLGDDIALSAYGLTANLTGEMSVRQKSPNPPQLGGEIEVVDGIYKQYGQNLEASGQILFVGPVNQTRLAIDAVRTIDNEDRVAGMRIQGTTETPEIVLFTEPADKQQDSILSYIVLGRDITEASDQEASLLTSAALALTVRGGRSIAGGIASALGVTDFGLETRGRGDDTELVVSGRLNEKLLLRYGRSVFQPESTLYLRYDLTKKLYLEAAQNAESAVDLFYSFSF